MNFRHVFVGFGLLAFLTAAVSAQAQMSSEDLLLMEDEPELAIGLDTPVLESLLEHERGMMDAADTQAVLRLPENDLS